MTQIHHLYFSQSQYFTQHDSQKQASASEAKWTSVEGASMYKIFLYIEAPSPPPSQELQIN